MVGLRTSANARVTLTLRVTSSKTTYTGHGKGRKRVTRAITLYTVGTQGTADRRGALVLRLRVSYKTPRPVQATLSIDARRVCAVAAHNATVTIVPPRQVRRG